LIYLDEVPLTLRYLRVNGFKATGRISFAVHGEVSNHERCAVVRLFLNW